MNHFVPDFDTSTDDNYVNVNSNPSPLHPPRKPIIGGGDEEDGLMELLWQNGQVVVQNQRLNKKQPSSSTDHKLGEEEAVAHLFIQEDEMTSWLHNPDDFCSDVLFPAEKQTTSQVSAAKPLSVRNFANFSMLRDNNKSGPSVSKAIVRESTQVHPVAADRKGKEVASETEKTVVDERKRKERETAIEETEENNNKQQQREGRGTTCTKRSRAAEVHNLSERKRRDRINERMKALQELIPRCNKSDKASMLDEAIEYMKSLQLQIQMMSMGCGMMPMMYAGMQQYMPPHMAMGMGMGMGMNPPLPSPSFMPFPNMLPAQRPFPTQTHMGGGYPAHVSDPPRVYLPNQQSDPTSNQPPFPGYMDPYQQFRNLHPTQPPQFQNQATSYPSSSRVSSSKESENQGNRTTG